MLLKPEPLSEEQYEAQNMARRENQQIIEKYLSLKALTLLMIKWRFFPTILCMRL